MGEKMKFEIYGELEWLEPTDYYAGPWRYLETVRAEDGKMYDIVVMNRHYPCERRYTVL